MTELIKSNDIYTLASYIIGVIFLTVMAVASFRAKKRDENVLRKLQKQLDELSKKTAAGK